MQLPLIVVHGGAGNWKDERIPVGIEHVEKAAIAGFKVLETSGSALDAAEVCTSYMESCGQLNAGRGARPNSDGELELDALIIDGSKLDFGAVGAVTGIVNPVSLARYVMEKTDYKFFVGNNAKRVYDQMIAEGYREEIAEGDLQPADAPSGDTVGCIVVDSDGNIAATSSTGGIKKKIPGRVGDSPVMGAGAFANEICGASATGWGEHIMRVVLSRMTVLYVEEGLDVTAAAHKGIKMFEEKTGSKAGIIVADRSGNYGFSHNAKAMPLAIISRELKNMTSHACRE
ncbi:MAG: asparaginase [Candidatus Thorarchaeota archaeon]|nr:MAG: asparaginase [Candidatus Thorarchaeota archaeon]